VLAQSIRNQQYSDTQAISIVLDILTNESVSIRVKEAVEELFTNLMELSTESTAV
jgi:hypothetical protein